MVWTLVEPGVAISAASLVTIRPLLRALNISGFDATDEYHGPYDPNRPRTRHAPAPHDLTLRSGTAAGNWQNIESSNELTARYLAEPESPKINVTTTVTTEQVLDDNTSEECIL
jgi:hypothetical protein